MGIWIMGSRDGFEGEGGLRRLNGDEGCGWGMGGY